MFRTTVWKSKAEKRERFGKIKNKMLEKEKAEKVVIAGYDNK